MFKEPLEDGTGERLVYDFDGTGDSTLPSCVVM
jgi:hypothetical protein